MLDNGNLLLMEIIWQMLCRDGIILMNRFIISRARIILVITAVLMTDICSFDIL